MTFRTLNRTRSLIGFSVVLTLTFSQTLLTFAQQKPAKATAPAAKRFDLTIDNIMRGPELVGYEPRAVRWSGDSQRIYFQWKQANDPRDADFDTYQVNRDGTGLKRLSEEEAKNTPPLQGDQSKDKQYTLLSENGDIVMYDNQAGTRRRITQTTEIESNPRFTRDPRRIAFARANNLFVMALDSGSLEQFTDIRTGGAGAPQPPSPRTTESQEYLKKEERELLDIIKRRAEKREADDKKRERESKRKPFSLAPRQSVNNLQLTPDEKYVIANVFEPADGAKNSIVPNYVTESAYTEDLNARSKVGDAQGRTRLLILNVETGESKWVEHGLRQTSDDKADGSATISESESAANNPPNGVGESAIQQGARAAENRERSIQLFQPLWSDDGTKVALMARSADNKDRWILALDPTTAKTRVIFTDHDDAWIGGPGSFTFGWMPDNQRLYFQSERTGYAHLYTIAFEGGEPQALTSGQWEVTGVRLADDKTHFQLTTSEVHPGERHFYRLSLNGGERTKITSVAGNHQAVISPDGKHLAVLYSYSNKPTELFIQENRPAAPMTKVTSSPAPDFATYNWIDPPIVTFQARDGATVYARLYKPATAKRGSPAVIFVHGAGYLQNVHRWWSNYFREYMFHHFLMENGYTVLDIDYRASAGYGRDWRTGIYRHMGGKDLSDHVDAAKWLVSEHGIDPKRIGIYGGSYGGFITLMAMFTEPDVFAAGAALRPVTDWAHYNHGYTSNILNTPQKDKEAYTRSSPIYFAEGLKGGLLICHGMVDVNVHFQDTVRLVQRLIELRKENWEAAIYPIEDHGFVEPTSWADEYKRIFKLFETHLKKGMTATR